MAFLSKNTPVFVNLCFQSPMLCDIIQGMKNKIAILSSLICLCGANTVQASECFGPECDIAPMYSANVGQPTALNMYASETITESVERPATYTAVRPQYVETMPVVSRYSQPVQYVYADQIPMRQVKLLSIKPVPSDNRPAVWDGTQGEYVQRGYDKTVDWRDGVPIWDDSISNYKEKDFSDWFNQPLPELYLREADSPVPTAVTVSDTTTTDYAIDLYNQNMADAAATRQRVEELLAPQKPVENLWVDDDIQVVNNLPIAPMRPEYVAQDMTEVVKVTFASDDGCPFETETECNIWRRKPIVRETVSPRSPKIRESNINEFIAAARCNKTIDASDPAAAPLLQRYKMLMRSASACCTDGMAYALKQAGASDGLVYKFLADDANFYGFGSRCLMMTDKELDTKYPNTATAAVAADVRNGCLCRGRQWFTAMLAPFNQVYNALPEFKDAKFYYTYTDGLQRKTLVSINNDVQNVMNQLAQCP